MESARRPEFSSVRRFVGRVANLGKVDAMPRRREAEGKRAVTIAVAAALLAGCTSPASFDTKSPANPASPAASAVSPSDPYAAERGRMVEDQIAARGVRDPAVLAAMRRVARHEFVPEPWRREAYADRPLPIGEEQTISQPYIVALMTELAAVGSGSRVLEVGTGSGYQAAVLAELGAEVHTIEIVAPLARRAQATLERLGYGHVHVRQGDGYRGWPEAAPFDAIVVTAAPPEVPSALVAQLAPGGRLVIPVGTENQVLQVHERTADGFRVRKVLPVRFVPMTGDEQPRR
jgi:protein-L-isoaspartate(D-aspartate) O-methyltransferase